MSAGTIGGSTGRTGAEGGAATVSLRACATACVSPAFALSERLRVAASRCDRNSRRRSVRAEDMRKSKVDVGRVTLGCGGGVMTSRFACVATPFGGGLCCRGLLIGAGGVPARGVESRLVSVCLVLTLSSRVSCFIASLVSDPFRVGDEPF